LIDKTTIQSMTCDFETVDGGCLFDDIADDDFDWTRNSVSLFLYYDYLFTIKMAFVMNIFYITFKMDIFYVTLKTDIF
jgi:hypothetical protein